MTKFIDAFFVSLSDTVKKRFWSLEISHQEMVFELFDNIQLNKNHIYNSPKTLRSLIAKKKYPSAVSELLRIIKDTWLQKKNPTKTWLQNYQHLDTYISKITSLPKKSLKCIKDISLFGKGTWTSLFTTLQWTYLQSKITQSQHTKIDEYQILYEQLKPWSIILLNAELCKASANSLLWASLINSYLPHSDHWTHAIMISKSWKKPMMIQATMKKQIDGKPWVEEIHFDQYIRCFNTVDLLVLEAPEKNRRKSLKYARHKVDISEDYDFGAAASRWTNGIFENIPWFTKIFPKRSRYVTDHPDRVNCVELIAEWLDIESIHDIAFPEEFLDEKILKPVYMCSLKK